MKKHINSILQDDFDILIKETDLSCFDNKTVLVTGATGLIGSVVAKTLLYSNMVDNHNIKIVAIVRDLNKAKEIYNNFVTNNLTFVKADLLLDTLNYDGKVDYIVHAASITNSKTMVTSPVNTILTAVIGTNKLLNLAMGKKVQGFTYISSMEIYGNVKSNIKISETDLGFIDISNVRSCYPESKRMCECLCNAYAKQYGINVNSARLAQTFGAGILANENRVFAQFARSAINGKDIVLHTLGQSEGNYVYIRDAVKAILLLLIKGLPGQAYNICNESSHIKIKDMAKMVASKFSNGRSNVVFDIPIENGQYGYAPDVKLRLDASKIMALGWTPKVNLEESYFRMIQYMKEEKMF